VEYFSKTSLLITVLEVQNGYFFIYSLSIFSEKVKPFSGHKYLQMVVVFQEECGVERTFKSTC